MTLTHVVVVRFHPAQPLRQITAILKWLNKNAEEILTSFGFHCLYCPCSQMESLEQACEVHEIDVNELLKALNK